MLFPLEALAEATGTASVWPVILLVVAAAMVVFFMVVQLRRILRRGKRSDER